MPATFRPQGWEQMIQSTSSFPPEKSFKISYSICTLHFQDDSMVCYLPVMNMHLAWFWVVKEVQIKKKNPATLSSIWSLIRALGQEHSWALSPCNPSPQPTPELQLLGVTQSRLSAESKLPSTQQEQCWTAQNSLAKTKSLLIKF